MWREETHIEKNPRFKDKNQQQTQPTYDVKSKIHGSFLLRVHFLKHVFYFINSWINLLCIYLQTQAKFNLWEVSALATALQETAKYLRNQIFCCPVKFFLVSEIFLPWKLHCIQHNYVITVGNDGSDIILLDAGNQLNPLYDVKSLDSNPGHICERGVLSPLRYRSLAPQETAKYLRNQISCFVVKIFLVIEILLPWKLSCV